MYSLIRPDLIQHVNIPRTKLSEVPEDMEIIRVCPYCHEFDIQMLGEDGIDFCEGCRIVEGYIGKAFYRTEEDELVEDDL